MPALRKGDAAPTLPMSTQDGDTISLADYQGQHPVVLYFYPKDDTPICTMEACSFRDAYDDFRAAGAVVIGVSGDTQASHRRFIAQHDLPFLLVADTDGALRRAFGLPSGISLFNKRITFVIDQEGTIRHAFESRFAAGQHVEEALAVVQDLAASA